MMMKVISIAALTASSAALAAPPQQARPTAVGAPARAGVMSMDVAGVRLGMPLEQATAALRDAGYLCHDQGMREQSFADAVAKEVDKRRGRAEFFDKDTAVAEITCDGRGGEQLSIFFAQPAGGSVVDELSLHLPGDRFATADVMRQVETKYGRPTVGTVRSGKWCDPGYRCGQGGLSDGPIIFTDIGTNATISAMRGLRASKADDAAVMAEADRIAPKSARAAF